MPRRKRKRSGTGIYHVMVRGNGKKIIFKNDKDKKYFLNLLIETKRKLKFVLFSYCLMHNHFHLIIKENDENISKIMKAINVSYALYFNKCYDKVGHVFQGRYKSEPIEDRNYLLTAVRYVHNNPVKAKIVKEPEDYKWSSYHEYINLGYKGILLIERNLLLKLFSCDLLKAVSLFKKFTRAKNEDNLIDIEPSSKKTTIKGLREAEGYVNKYIKKENIDLYKLKSRNNIRKRNKLIRDLRKKSNLSIREIAKLLKINRGMVSYALKNESLTKNRPLSEKDRVD
ncbi:MAG: transposase [Halanaerobiaceae bacterium]